MIALSIIGLVFAVTLYVGVAVKIALWVGDKTEGSGFAFGWYMVTASTLVAIPFAIFVQVAS